MGRPPEPRPLDFAESLSTHLYRRLRLWYPFTLHAGSASGAGPGPPLAHYWVVGWRSPVFILGGAFGAVWVPMSRAGGWTDPLGYQGEVEHNGTVIGSARIQRGSPPGDSLRVELGADTGVYAFATPPAMLPKTQRRQSLPVWTITGHVLGVLPTPLEASVMVNCRRVFSRDALLARLDPEACPSVHDPSGLALLIAAVAHSHLGTIFDQVE